MEETPIPWLIRSGGLVLGAALLVVGFQNCGQPFSVANSNASNPSNTSSGSDGGTSNTTAPPSPTGIGTQDPASASAPAPLRTVRVANTAQLADAMASAQPGDLILLAPGTYPVGDKLRASRAGSADHPIVVKAETQGTTVLESNTPEMIAVSAPYWRFENLEARGVCANDDDCEHAFHITGAAHFLVIRGNTLRDFNAQIKANGDTGLPDRPYPNDVRIENNTIIDSSPRHTANPVDKIDVVGGRRWVIRGNFIADFEKDGGNGVSYGAFLKGHSYDGLMENNIVACSLNHSGGARIGLSFGGGGTGGDVCEEHDCSIEHVGGIMRNNLIVNCSDVGIYLNNAQSSVLLHNTLSNTSGIDVRFANSSADARGNLIFGGAIRNRDGGISTSTGNLTATLADLASWFVNASSGDFSLRDGQSFVDRGPTLPSPLNGDLCASDTRQNGKADLGAIEYAPAGTSCPALIKSIFDRNKK